DSEARIRGIMDHVVDGIIIINKQGIIESFNPACERIFGYTASEVIGKNVKVLMPEPYHSEHDQYLENYHNSKKPKIIGIGREVQGKRKDGTIFPLDLAVGEVHIKGKTLYSGIIRDITERKKAEEKLQNTTNALKRSNEELERFAYVASHDLK